MRWLEQKQVSDVQVNPPTMHVLGVVLLLSSLAGAVSVSQRRKVVQSFSVRRNASSDSTPLQVGNGNFAFGADVTGLQTFKPFGILSTWCWHNFSLPTTPGQTSIDGKPRHRGENHEKTRLTLLSRLYWLAVVDSWQADHLQPTQSGPG